MINLAVVGATGVVGSAIINSIVSRCVPYKNLFLFSSDKSAGTTISVDNKDITLQRLDENSFNNIDVAIFSAGGDISRKFAPIAKKNGCIVIDNSSAFRMDQNVPLIVPEVNKDLIKTHKNIIANPNCSTIQAMLPLFALHKVYGIKRVVYSTYQAVSGAGKDGISDLENNLLGVPCKKLNHPIANNCIPHIDSMQENGYTFEEEKMINETKKILGDNIKVTATCVRVPVFDCHAESINVELDSDFDLDQVKTLFNNQRNLIHTNYPMQIYCKGKEEVFVGRLRRDFSLKNGINMWVVADNVLKGAATNAVQIAEYIIEGYY